MITPTLIISLVFAAVAAAFIVRGLMVVQQSEAIVIERLGSYNRTLTPGVNWVIPFLDNPRSITVRRYETRGDNRVAVVRDATRIDQREVVLDFPGQNVVTRDNVTVVVNGALYFRIMDPKRAVYEVENFVQAIEVLAKTSLRSEIGKMELDKIFESREEVNSRLQVTMDEVGDKWGVKVTRVEIQDISMPEEVEEAMRLQMAAERKRRATVTEANGAREAEITRAEGERQAKILTAEGEKQAAVLQAEGQQQAIGNVLKSLGDDPQSKETTVGYLLGLEYLRQLPDMAKQGDRVFIPYEASSFIGALGSFRELSGGEALSAAARGMAAGGGSAGGSA